jgi:Protein of unknown function (DUF3999)
MRRRLAALLTICLAHAARANSPADYAYTFPIETTAQATSGESSAWRVELTPEVYRWVQDADLRDVEVFNAERQPVPFARIALELAATAREQIAMLPVLDLPASTQSPAAGDLRLVIDRDADGRLRRIDAGEQSKPARASRDWLLDASHVEHAIDSLVLSWRAPASGIVAHFAIDASEDLQNWRGVGDATVLLLEQQGARLERRDIALGGVHAKYLRLHRLDDGEAIVDLHVEAHSLELSRAAPARKWIDATSTPTPPGETAPAGTTRFDYSLPSALPIETARIELASDNALAPITLLARADDASGASWLHIGTLTAFRLRQRDDTLHNGDIDMQNVRRLRDFRIDSTTTIAKPPRLSLGFRPDSVVFLAEGNAPFLLAAGSVRTHHADYPIQPALASLRASLGKDWQPPVATLGVARVAAGDAALRAPPPPFAWRRWLLGAILLAGAVLIAVFALSLLRGAKRTE